jgi:hypothetical protein
MPDPMKNKDRDEKHRRRRRAGEDEDRRDGREVADALYGGPANSDTDGEDDGAQ